MSIDALFVFDSTTIFGAGSSRIEKVTNEYYPSEYAGVPDPDGIVSVVLVDHSLAPCDSAQQFDFYVGAMETI